MQIILHLKKNLLSALLKTLALMALLALALGQIPMQNAQAQSGMATLILTKTIDGDITNAEVGDTIFYRIRFACSSLTTDCGELEITDVLPTNPNPPNNPLFTYVPADSSVPSGFSMVEGPTGTITITKDTPIADPFKDGSQFDAVIAVRINYDARPLPATVTNGTQGRIRPPGETVWELSVTATAPPLIIDTVTANWDLTKARISPSIEPTLDTDVTYRLQLCPASTSGNVALTDIEIIDTLPEGVVFVGATGTYTYTPEDAGPPVTPGTVVWSIAGPITPPSCATRYITVRYPSSAFSLNDEITNTASATADYVASNGNPCPDCIGTGPVPVTHDIIDIVEGVTYSKDDAGDPVGIDGTARFILNLNTNFTNYPANAVTLIDTLPHELEVTAVTSGTWSDVNVRAVIQYSTDLGATWVSFPSQPVSHNTNATYNSGLPDNITNVRWVFEYDSDLDDLNGNGDVEPLPGLPYDWTFSTNPQIRVTPRAVSTTASDGTPMPAVDPLTIPQTYTNCVQVSRIDSTNTLVTGACNNEEMTVEGNYVSLRTTKAETPGGGYDPVDDPLINNFTADSNILPNDTLRYVLTVDITERSSADLVNPTIQDTLPAELIFVRNGTAQLDGVDLPPAQQPTFTQVGQNLKWEWNNPSPALTVSPLALGSRYLTVSFYARVPPGTPPADNYTNNLYVTTDSDDLLCEIPGTDQTDNLDIDGDGNNTEDACKNSDTFRVERSAALRGEKWIRSVSAENSVVVRFNTFLPDASCPVGGTAGLAGSTNPFTRYPCISQAYPEGALGATQHIQPVLPATVDPTLDDFEYNLRIFNEGNVPMLEYVLYDILPSSGDKGSGGTLVNEPRNSEFRPVLRGPVSFISGTGVAAGNFAIQYSASANPCRPEVFDKDPVIYPNTPAGCTNDWMNAAAAAALGWDNIRAYHIELTSGSIPQAVPAEEEPRFGVPMSIPNDSPTVGVFDNNDPQSREIAWNSFSHVGSYDKDPDPSVEQIQDLLASEPRKVGITIPERLSIGNRVWRDSDNSGTINPPDDTNPGIANVTVNLYDAADTSTPIATTTTDTGGYYLFSNLPEGNYVVGIPASNFDNIGDPLYSLRSSTGTPASAAYTNPPETNPDSEDHGIDSAAVPPTPSTEVFSAVIPLERTTEPVSESDLSDNNRDGPEGTRRGLNGERDYNSDLTVDFGFFGGSDVPFSIGNYLWYDNGAGGGTVNDGIRQTVDTGLGTEPPVTGARVDLYRDGNLDGTLTPAELIRWDITDPQGFYLFDNLDPGRYYVVVSAGNFMNSFDPDGTGPLPSAPGVLRGWYSSQPTGTETADINGLITNLDNDDNGVNTNYPESQGVRSGVIVLERGVDESLSEPHLSSDSSTASGFNPTAGDGIGHIGRFGETDATSNMTIDFGFIPPMSLGNRVWIDDGAGEATFRAGYNNGIMDGTESGVNGVRVELWRDLNNNNTLDSGEFIRFTTTDAQGYYLFDRIQPGSDYYVHIPASNFASGAPLENYISSYDTNQTTVPDDDTEDRDDNGIDNGNVPTDNGITSPLIVMAYTTEPTTETDLSLDTATYGTNNVGLYGQANNNSNLTMDFGFVYPPRSIGNHLWFDLGGGAGGVVNDGIRNGTEGPVANARVSLYLDAIADGQPDDLGVIGNRTDDWVAYDETDANGYYLFDNLPPGNYIVGVDRDNFDNTGVGDTYISLFGYTSSTGNVDNASNDLDSRDNGVDRPNPIDATLSPHGILSTRIDLTTNPLTLPSGETGSGDITGSGLTNNPTSWDGPIPDSRGRYGETDANSDLTIDFGFVEAYSIGNRVWFDTNNNAIMDAGEVGVDGVQVQIYLAAITLPTGPVIDTQVTANGGYYLFDHLPPNNYVVVVTADNFNSTGTYNALVGYWSSLTDRSGANGAIAETAAPDPDANGPDGLPRTADDDVDLDDNGLRRTTAGAFQNAVLALPVTVGPTGLTEPTDDNDLDATLPGDQQGQPDGRANMKVDFGFYRTEIGNLVYEDINLNGTYNLGETLLNGVTVRLYQLNNSTEVRVGPDGILGTADDNTGGVTTGPNASHPTWGNGEYHFSGLPEGDYIVRVTAGVPAGMISTIDTADQTDNNNPDTNTDNNDNGVGEGPVTVTSNVTNRLTTDPGSTGAQGNNTVAQATGTTTDNTVDFGFVYSYSLGNRIWYDTNNNGVLDAGEAGINGVRVELYRDTDGNGFYTPGTDTFVNFTTTAASGGVNGYYRFDNLFPRDYIVVIPADNFRNVGALDTVPTDPLRSYWSTGTRIDGSGVISESPTNDPDTDNDASGVAATSDENGATTFSGNTINYVAAAAVTLGSSAEPTTDNDPAANPQTGEAPNNRSNRTVDFGFYQVAIGNLVFSDNDVSGHFNAGDTALSGVLVHLFASDGITEIITGADGIPGTADDGFGPDGVAGGGDDGTGGVRTDGAGNYLFSGLPQGNYIVIVDAPAGMVSTIDSNPQADNDNPNTNIDNNDNGDGLAGGTVTFDAGDFLIMNPGVDALKPNRIVSNASGTTTDPTIDFGFVGMVAIGNRVWIDDGAGTIANANNGILDAGEVGLNNVTVQLYGLGIDGIAGTADDNLVGATTTASIGANAGYYQFDNLFPGQYYVKIPASEFSTGGDLVGYASSIGNGGLNDDDDQSGVNGDENGIDNADLAANGIVTPVYNLLPGAEPTTDEHAGIYTGALSNDSVNFTADFGFFYPLSIGNRVFLDNGAGIAAFLDNGIMNAGELPIENVRVELWRDTNGTAGLQVSGATPDTLLRFDITDAGGYYLFDGLHAGEYYIHIPAVNFTTGALQGTNNSAPTGTENGGVAGNPYTPNTDRDDNGVNNTRPDLNGISSGPILLVRDAEPTGETELSSDTGVVFGNDPTMDDGPNSRGRYGESDNNSNLTIDFGFVPVYSLGNRVWLDTGGTTGTPNNGIMDGDEAGISGLPVRLYRDADNDGVPDGPSIQTTNTDANGYYRFDNLTASTYIVEVVPTAGLGSTVDVGQDPDDNADLDDNGVIVLVSGEVRSKPITLGDLPEPTGEEPAPNPAADGEAPDAQSNRTVDFGFVGAVAIGNVIWFDTGAGTNYNNGIFDTDESGVDNVTVQLYTAAGVEVLVGPDGILGTVDDAPGGMLTSGGGYYRFDRLIPGDYYVYIPAAEFQAGGDLYTYLSSSDDAPATVSQIADNDADENGIDGTPTNPLTVNGIRTIVYNLIPAAMPTGEGQSNYTGTLPDNSVNFTADFGFVEAYSLGNRVWHDINKDGIRNDGTEPGLDNITVNLYLESDPVNIFLTTTTDVDGYYRFDNLVAGNYIVEVVPPAGYASTIDAGDPDSDPDDDDDNGINFVGSNVRSNPVTLGPGGTEPINEDNPSTNPEATLGEAPDDRSNRTVDFGFILANATSNKQLTSTVMMDNGPTPGTDTTTTPEVTIGEILTYVTRLQIPSGETFTNLRAVDQLGTGLAFVGCDSINVSDAGLITDLTGGFDAACNNPGTTPPASPLVAPRTGSYNDANQITFTLGEVFNNTADTQILAITYQVIVLDIPANQNGIGGLINSIVWSWDGTTLPPSQADPVQVVEPDLSIDKRSTPRSAPYGTNIRFTISIAHTAASSMDAFDVVVNDILPVGLQYVAGSVQFAGLAPNVPVAPADYYDPAANTLTFYWDTFPLGSASTITFAATFVGPAPVVNSANVIWTSLPIDPQPGGTPVSLSPFNDFSTERWYDPADLTGLNPYGRSASVRITLPVEEERGKKNPWILPATGFAPNVITELPPMPADFAYAQTDILLEIPKLKQTVKLAGVPYDNEKGEWNLTWLNTEAGWLENTAFPTHAGNSALTAHTTLSNGQPGPFAKLGTLSYGDQIIIHLDGQKYIFEVRENKQVKPSAVSSTLKHEEYPWLTLITCKSYNEKTGEYTYRTVARAVLVKVVDE